MTHLKKELSMENLLFLTIILQWQDYLLKHELWEEDNPKCRYVLDAHKRIQLPNKVANSIIIREFANIVIDDHKRDDDSFDFFGAFAQVFIQIYQQYMEVHRAPFEINISSQLRRKMRSYYDKIVSHVNQNQDDSNSRLTQKQGKQTEVTFWDMWHDLTLVCNQLQGAMLDSLLRCDF